MKLEFKPGDFKDWHTCEDAEPLTEWIAGRANDRLKEMLAACPVVYGYRDNGLWTNHEQPGLTDTHRALLVNIEPIDGIK